MEKRSILENISSINIFDNIFSFLKDANYKLKLFAYSNLLQKKLNLQLADYEKAYIELLGINIYNYLFCKNNIFPLEFNKDILKIRLEKDLSKYNLEKSKLEKIIVDIFKKKYEDEKNVQNNSEKKLVDSLIQIDIYSPFFDILSKTEFFGDIFTITMSMYIIDKKGLKDDYYNTFYNLNFAKSNYSLLRIYIEDSYDILLLKEFNVNFHKIKRINFMANSFHITGNYNYFLNTFFSYFYNIENNLTSVKLNCINLEFEPKQLEKLNNFKSLEVLNLTGFKFTDTFILKMSNLKSVTLDSCENIGFEENICLNIKKLNLNSCSISKHKSLIEVPNLEECELTYSDISDQRYYTIFNISSFKKLKTYIGEPCDFIFIESNLLEYLNLISYYEVPTDDILKILKKIINSKYLKEVIIGFDNINKNEILYLIGRNTSVRKIQIHWVPTNEDLSISNLLNKFTNLQNLEIISPAFYNFENTIINIVENKGCKISKFNLIAGEYRNIEFYCQPFENLIEIKITLNCKVINLKDTLPLFNTNCKVEFSSLNTFYLECTEPYSLKIYTFENLCNNLDKMPNISNLYIKCVIDCNTSELDNEFYTKFIKKCLSMNLNKIYLSIKINGLPNNIEYSKDELLELYPGLKYSKYKEICIKKLKK